MKINKGDIIVYAREDYGSSVTWEDPDTGAQGGWQFVGTLSHIAGAKSVEAEKITVGIDIPARFAQRLVDDGVCAVWAAPALAAPAADDVTKSKSKEDKAAS